MYELEIQSIDNLKQRLSELRTCLNVEGVQEHISRLEKSMEALSSGNILNKPRRFYKNKN